MVLAIEAAEAEKKCSIKKPQEIKLANMDY
jgi:hypothetical protein